MPSGNIISDCFVQNVSSIGGGRSRTIIDTPKDEWKTFYQLLRCGKSPTSQNIGVNEFGRLFNDTVAGCFIADLSRLVHPVSTWVSSLPLLLMTLSVTFIDFRTRLPLLICCRPAAKTSCCPIKSSHILSTVFNLSPAGGQFPSTFLSPTLKKAGLDADRVQL